MAQDASPASRLLLSAVPILKDDANDPRIYSTTAGVWQEYLDLLVSTGRELGATDVLLMLADLAKAKSTLDPKNPAHFTEMVACIAGAAQLAGATPPEQVEPTLPKVGSPPSYPVGHPIESDQSIRDFASKFAPKPEQG